MWKSAEMVIVRILSYWNSPACVVSLFVHHGKHSLVLSNGSFNRFYQIIQLFIFSSVCCESIKSCRIIRGCLTYFLKRIIIHINNFFRRISLYLQTSVKYELVILSNNFFVCLNWQKQSIVFFKKVLKPCVWGINLIVEHSIENNIVNI